MYIFILSFILTEESLDIKTGKCESIIDKRFYSAEYIQAVYVPDHQLTMYTDLVMMNHSNREWQEDEIFDLPFPTEAMKIRICRSRGSLKGLQIYMDVGTDNTGYSGLLGRYTLQLKWSKIPLNVFVAKLINLFH